MRRLPPNPRRQRYPLRQPNRRSRRHRRDRPHPLNPRSRRRHRLRWRRPNRRHPQNRRRRRSRLPPKRQQVPRDPFLWAFVAAGVINGLVAFRPLAPRPARRQPRRPLGADR
jgi:hypothetical protein